MRELIERVLFTVQDKLMIGDPYYINEDDFENGVVNSLNELGLLLNDCAGEWVAEVEYSNDHDRVVRLRAKRTENRQGPFIDTLEVKAGVDSGQMFIGCMSEFGLDYDELLKKYKLPNDEWNDDLHFFGFGEGAVSSTGYGDGLYPVYVTRDRHQRVVQVDVLFLDEDGEEFLEDD